MNIVSRLTLVALTVVSCTVRADVMLKLATIYLSSSSGSGVQTTTSRMLIDVNPAYITQKGWAFGGIYAQESINSTGSQTVARTSMGPSVGWVSRRENGFYAIAHYFFSSEVSPLKGSGYQADLGYKFKIKKVALGLQMSYKGFTYTESNGTKLSEPQKETKIDPYFVLLIEF